MTRRPPLALLRSSDAVLQTVAWLRKQGFKPVPLHKASKAATSRDYVKPDYKPPNDDIWLHNDYGVGMVTGPQAGGAVDSDLDCDEAIDLAPRFLPPTNAIFGRESKKASHYLYRVDTASFEKIVFTDPVDNSVILELRGDGGHQTVAPGSVHEGTGELVRWETVAFPEVPTVQADILIKSARKLAITVLIARHVWQPGYHNEPCKHIAGMFYYLDWPIEDVIEVISTVMEMTGDEDKSRIPTIKATYKRAADGKKVSGAGVLRKQLKNDALVDRLLDLAGSPSVNLIQEYNERFAVVNLAGKFRIADTDVAPGDPPVFWLKDDWLNMQSTDLSDMTDSNGRKIPKARVWLASPRRRTYRSVDFLPGQEDTSCLNLWGGWATEPQEGDCSGWLELLEDIVCGGDKIKTRWLLHWFANILREPMNKPLTAPVIIGVEGAGKSLLLSYFGEILGKAFVTVTNDEHIHGRFNSHLTNALVLHSEEALYAGDKKHAGVIRSLITDKTRILELKGIDARQIRNYLRLVITSNDLYSAPVKPGDRRYNIFDMLFRTIKANPKLLKKVLEELNGGGPAALHHYLITMDYDSDIPRTTIKDDSLLALKSINLPPLETWWLETLKLGQLLPDYLAWASLENADGGKDDWPQVVSSSALYKAMVHYCKAINQTRNIPNGTLFSLQLSKFVGETLFKVQKTYANPMLDEWPQDVKLMSARQNTIINMPTLANCRKAFERYMGQEFDWPAEEVRRVEPKQHDKF